MNWKNMDGQFSDYLRDESRLEGRCGEICFPETAEELGQALMDCAAAGIPATVQGGRTGIVGAGVPAGGRLISTERLTGCAMEGDRLNAGCGTRLNEIQATARRAGLRFPPNPTEDTATIGGLFACAASGPNCTCWGSVADHIASAVILLAGGRRWEVARGQYVFDETGCPLPDGSRLSLTAPLPEASAPRWGFAPCVGMDLLDLFCGSEGTLGVAAELGLSLSPLPAQTWGLLFFFREEGQGAGFAGDLAGVTFPDAVLTTAEYLDGATLGLIQNLKRTASRLAQLPPFPERQGAAVYLELEAAAAAPPQRALMDCMVRFARNGGQEPDTWAASGETELARLRLLRHAAAEAVNTRLDACRQLVPGLTKLCGAFQTPPEKLAEAAARYRADLERAGIPGAVFGHALAGRLHVNLLPESEEQRQRAQDLLEGWAEAVKSWGGSPLAENGIGKTRRAQLDRWAPAGQLALMREIKARLDPAGLLNPGSILV